jgi:hypothetical protein
MKLRSVVVYAFGTTLGKYVDGILVNWGLSARAGSC